MCIYILYTYARTCIHIHIYMYIYLCICINVQALGGLRSPKIPELTGSDQGRLLSDHRPGRWGDPSNACLAGRASHALVVPHPLCCQDSAFSANALQLRWTAPVLEWQSPATLVFGVAGRCPWALRIKFLSLHRGINLQQCDFDSSPPVKGPCG